MANEKADRDRVIQDVEWRLTGLFLDLRKEHGLTHLEAATILGRMLTAILQFGIRAEREA